MLRVRNVGGVKMYEAQQWLVVALLQALVLSSSCGNHHRRAAATQANFQQSKGGWRPVVSSGGLLYGSFGTAPLHAQAYKIPVPVIDYSSHVTSSSRPIAVRDAAKVTSIAQSYRPTTLRTVPSQPPAPPANQPINSYYNPFAIQNNALTHFKYVQNFPADSMVLRNTNNPYAARPVYTKYPTKFKQPTHNSMLQQLTNIQPLQFGQYQTAKPLEVFGKPIESYARPDKKQYSSGTEVFKPQVFELTDSDTAPQSISQQVKTAQQQGQAATQKTPIVFPQFSYQDSLLPSNILGTFGSYSLQSIKGRDPVFPTTKTTYFASQPTKQTIFNSFSFAPNYKTTPTFSNIFSTTTPKLQTTPSYATFGSFNDFKVTATQQTKPPTSYKIDPNAGSKNGFKPSPQDPFIKQYQSNLNQISVTTYNPTTQSTTASNYYNDYNFPSQQNSQIQNYYNQQGLNYNYDQSHKIQDSLAAGVNHQAQQYTNPPNKVKNVAPNTLYRPTYEVTETTEAENIVTHSSPAGWGAVTSQSYDDNQKSTEEPKKNTTPQAVEEYAIVTEAEKSYDNSLNFDGQVESQSRRPLGDDFEPIGKHKLKDYYYKVSTPVYDDYITTRRTKKPTEASKYTVQPETTTMILNDIPIETLPTLPPNRHFKRPSATEPIDKDKIRKRNKNRRRRPPLGNRNRDETSTRAISQSSESSATTESDEIYTVRPRFKTTNTNPTNPTTPSVTTDLTTSALPTISPTAPTIVKKKLGHRRPFTTISSRLETTTQIPKDYDTNKDSPIMKIANRPHFPKITTKLFDFTTETPDYSHKQDEKDTPTSDVSVSISDSKSAVDSAQEFSFHKDVKPIEAKLESVTRETTTEFVKDSDYINEVTTATIPETTTSNGRVQRPRLRNKFNTRPKFSVKDYRSRLSSTTSTTEKTVENSPKVRFPQRRGPNVDNETENVTERKKFTPKDPRYKQGNSTEGNEPAEKETYSIRQSLRQRQNAADTSEGTTQKISARIRNGSRKPRPTEESTETTPTTINKRPLRKKIKDADIEESVQEITIAETTAKNDITSERARSESAIMKIADKKHQDHNIEHLYEHSKRVSDLTLAASKDYNKPGMFKTISSNSRRIPNYFTIATDDPILPIEAFFPQLNQKKES